MQNSAEQVQKFVPRSFGAFCTIWVHWGLFGCLKKLGAKQTELVQKSHRNFSQRTHPIHPIEPKTDVLVRFVLFGCIRDHLVSLRNSVQKRAELVHKFVPRSRVGIFRNERTRSTALDPKLPFWCVSYYLGAFGTVWLRYETRCKTGRTSAKVRATKSRRNFSHRTHPIHPIGP